MKFTATDEVSNLGIKILTAQINNLTNFKSSQELDEYINNELYSISKNWERKNYKDNPILEGFKVLHTKVGRSNRDYPASPEVLLRLFLDTGRFPRINAIVDIYNLISLKSQLALGAHDIKYINENVSLRLTNGDETFIPLGKVDLVKVAPGEYAYCDDENNIICRMEVL